MDVPPGLTAADVEYIDGMIERARARIAAMPAAEKERRANRVDAAMREAHRPRRPAQREGEGVFAYSNRAWRWEMWYFQEPRPDLWYATPEEAADYRQWCDAELRERGYDRYGKELE